MSGPSVPRIGVVSDSPLQLFELQSALRDAAYEVVLACEPAKLSETLLQRTSADAWVVSLSEDSGDSGEIVSLLLDEIEVPVLLDESTGAAGSDGESDWSVRMLGKLEQLAPLRSPTSVADAYGHNPLLAAAAARSSRRQVARNVWVLGASLGGPEAVTEFLRALPSNLPVSFIYVQHIDNNFSNLLSEVMDRNTELDAVLLEDGEVLSHGQLGIVPAEAELRFRPLGKVEATRSEWSGPYAPWIDQVIADIAGVYGDCAGAIIFSGMGDDGARSCELLHLRGGTVWAQEPATCICSAMPEAVIDTGLVEFMAGPAQLAEALARRYSPNTQRQERP